MMNQIKDFFKKYITAILFYFKKHENCKSFCLTCKYIDICREDRRGMKLKNGNKITITNLERE